MLRDTRTYRGNEMNLLNKILNKLSIVPFCDKCGDRLIFDQERFDRGYSARYFCERCNKLKK